jgi:hypothetical protein
LSKDFNSASKRPANKRLKPVKIEKEWSLSCLVKIVPLDLYSIYVAVCYLHYALLFVVLEE